MQNAYWTAILTVTTSTELRQLWYRGKMDSFRTREVRNFSLRGFLTLLLFTLLAVLANVATAQSPSLNTTAGSTNVTAVVPGLTSSTNSSSSGGDVQAQGILARRRRHRRRRRYVMVYLLRKFIKRITNQTG